MVKAVIHVELTEENGKQKHRARKVGMPPCTPNGKSGVSTSTCWLLLSAHGPTS